MSSLAIPVLLAASVAEYSGGYDAKQIAANGQVNILRALSEGLANPDAPQCVARGSGLNSKMEYWFRVLLFYTEIRAPSIGFGREADAPTRHD